MYRLLTLALAASFLGCAPQTSPKAKEESSASISTPALRSESPITVNHPTPEYPEMAEVMRLMVRATTLESNGKFEDALAVANQAAVVDPNSPLAIEFKARLEELLRRASKKTG